MTLDSQGQSLVIGGSSLQKFYVHHKTGKLHFSSPYVGQLLPNQEESTNVVAIVMDTSNTSGIVGTSDGSISSIHF